MFIGRKNELTVLNERYNKDNFECMIIYGRRRVGKTSLISEFCKDKPTIFFSALNSTGKENLEMLSKSIYEYENDPSDTVPVYQNYDDALNKIGNIGKDKRIVFVIDEYPYLASAYETISSKLQHIIDHKWKNSRIFLILCGSSMSFMENQVLGYQSPLYGRRTGQMEINALSFREASHFYPELNNEQQALLYGITGGIPLYIQNLDVKDDIDTSLKNNFFVPSSFLIEEPQNLLKQELREPAVYNSVITAIAQGASRMNDIATKVGLSTSVCTKYINRLISLGLIGKETPITEKQGKKTIYTIKDSLFRFWYRFVQHNITAVNSGRFPLFYNELVKRYMNEYMGLVFAQMCRDWLMYDVPPDDLPVMLVDIGQWWGTSSKLKKEIQIDIVGVSGNSNEYIIGSCKFRNEKIDTDELELIKSYAEVFGKGSKYYYYIFSKSGFTDELKKLGEKGEVKLITLEDMYDNMH